MRFWIILLGIVVGAAGYFIGGIAGIIGIALGVLIILFGLFSRKKVMMNAPPGFGTGSDSQRAKQYAVAKREKQKAVDKNVETARRLNELSPA